MGGSRCDAESYAAQLPTWHGVVQRLSSLGTPGAKFGGASCGAVDFSTRPETWAPRGFRSHAWACASAGLSKIVSLILDRCIPHVLRILAARLLPIFRYGFRSGAFSLRSGAFRLHMQCSINRSDRVEILHVAYEADMF